MLIKNGNVLNFQAGGFVRQDIRIIDGKITEIAETLDADKNEEICDASNKYITPGLIDAHSHICISEEGRGTIGDDCNDYSEAVMPYLDTIDAIYPFDSAVQEATAHGVTCACVCPGSDSVIGGMNSVIQLYGRTVEEMLIKRKAAIKCSFGENPKKAGYVFKSRMGNAYLLRKCIEESLDYKYRKNEALKRGDYFKRDIGKENMLLAIDKKIPFHAHAHRCDDICTAIRICKEYDIDLVIIHCTDGEAIIDHLAAHKYPVILGPTMYPRSKLESMSRSFKTAGILNKAGIKICITADHDVTPIYYLSVYAAQSVRAGLDEIEGLKSITKNPAEVLGIDDRKGEILVRKDADVVIWSKHPFDYDTNVETVYIAGKPIRGR